MHGTYTRSQPRSDKSLQLLRRASVPLRTVVCAHHHEQQQHNVANRGERLEDCRDDDLERAELGDHFEGTEGA